MIYLDVDLSYLTKNFEIGTQRINQYGLKSIDDIMEAEAENGNKAASNFDLSVLSKPEEILKLFKLAKPKNRFLILNQMSENQLQYIMQYLEPQDLVNGLKFFTNDKLIQLMYDLPKEQIAKVMLEKFSPEQFLKMIPEEEMDKFMESSKIDHEKVKKSIKQFPPELLEGMMENLTGKRQKGITGEQVVEQLNGMSPNKYKKALQAIPRQGKEIIIGKLTKDDKDMYNEFTKDALMFPLKQLEKPELIKNMAVIEPEYLIQMVSELPKDLMAVVATQIDPEQFADILCNKYQDILEEIAVGN